MTYQDIVQRRLEIANKQIETEETQLITEVQELPSWRKVRLNRGSEKTDQKCGGGRRVIKKKIGGK